MRIAYFINQYPTASHSFIRREILALERRGFDIQRFALRRDSAKIVDAEDRAEMARTRYVLEQPRLRILFDTLREALRSPWKFTRVTWLAIRIGTRSDRGVLRHLAYVAEACLLARWLREARIDHLHAHFGTNSAAIAMFCDMLGAATYSFTVHGPEEFDKAEFIAIGEKIRRAKFVAAITSFCRSQLYRQVDAAEWGKIHLVHCGLDHKFFDADTGNDEDSETVFTCIGRLCEQKGQLLLLDAFRELVDSGTAAKLVLAGDGPMRGAIERRIADYGLQDLVQITGWIDGDRVRQLLRSSRVMVLPSFAEGLPVVLMEAMAMQKPVITTYIAGIPELVQDQVNGWLVPAGCSDSIARALHNALETPAAVYRQMGSAGRKLVERRHNVDIEAEKLAGLFGGAP
ncbi:glycosyltransferase family 4 protein [Microbulbifer hainanensis]|uniref:glycosyltransferase family 4 protein n=1 Tax=Microbulbifer hainanensis TaxID=2735675 RepID=UPI001868D84A|nr:glycosyltransferase family 4 protein [Microbulbifer hainanensis]